jgi:excisionase family DNA binding protein
MDITKMAFSINEARQATGLGRSRLYEEIAAGRLRIAKSGRRTLVLAESLQSFLKALEDQAGGGK